MRTTKPAFAAPAAFGEFPRSAIRKTAAAIIGLACMLAFAGLAVAYFAGAAWDVCVRGKGKRLLEEAQ